MKCSVMKNILSIPIFLSILALTPMKVTAQAKITHIAVYVKDIQRSTDFYVKVFGFPKLDEPFKDGLHDWLSIGNNMSMHIIQAPWEPITINKHNHICFSVPDMDTFIQNLELLKIPYEDWPGSPNTITTRPDGVRQLYIRDPDGYWLEVNDEY
jgi:lactoylglutathione lyase